MTQVPAKVLTASRLDDPYVTFFRSTCEKYPGTREARIPGEFERSLALAGTSRVISRFNRQTEALAALLVSAVVSAALLFAVLVEDRHSKLADLTRDGTEAGGYLLPDYNSPPGGASQYGQTVQINSGQATSVDHVFARLFGKQLNNRTFHVP
jgi:hypothetical protein